MKTVTVTGTSGVDVARNPAVHCGRRDAIHTTTELDCFASLAMTSHEHLSEIEHSRLIHVDASVIIEA
ncbi:MAG: hypothetical protein WCA28_00130 [Bradyrhizobium sp.]